MKHYNDLPEVRIMNTFLVYRNISVPLHELWGGGRELIKPEQVEEKVVKYRQAWQPYEKKVLTGMCELLDLKFRQNTLDIYIAPWIGAFSDPLIIGTKFEPVDFVDVLTHEIIHRLLTDNTTVHWEQHLSPSWRNLFGSGHSQKALVHIPVHAVHKALYLDVLKKPDRFMHDVALAYAFNNQPYIDAWEYVEKHGDLHIIDQLKASYKQLAGKS